METCLGNIRQCIKIMLMFFDSNMFKMYFVYKAVKSSKNERVAVVVNGPLGQPSFTVK